jgi:hypothetical protein
VRSIEGELVVRYRNMDAMLKEYQQQKKRKLATDDLPAQAAPEAAQSTAQTTGLRLPTFYIIGAQKGGTMAAVKNLNKHPDIYVANEVHYFDRAWHTKDVKWYAAQFTTDKSVLGEKTPELIYVDECAPRMKEVSPHAKFLLFLREPVSRAYSAWNMNKSNGRESAPFDECVARNLNNLDEIRSYGTGEFHYVQRGFYIDQIERFLRVFPDRSRLHIVIAEQVRRDPATAYAKIFDFLGVSGFDFVPEDEHIGSYESAISPKVADRLRKVYAPHNERLFRLLGYRVPEWESGEGSSNEAAVTTNSSTSNMNKSSAAPASSKLPQLVSGASVGQDGVGCPLLSSSADFATIGRKHGTDKITHHGYHRFYPRFIDHYRSLPAGYAMLEIGVDQSHSLRTWLEYYPRAFIYGVDISIDKAGDRYRIFKADQSRDADMRRLVERELRHPLFLVLDDGSHIPEHQVACFDLLFQSQALLPGGTYIVEDIETSYWSRNGLYGYTTRYGYHHERSAMEIFKDVLDDVNAEFLTEENRRAQERRVGSDISAETRRLISSVTFGQNCIIITKKTAEEQSMYGDRPYRFRKNL